MRWISIGVAGDAMAAHRHRRSGRRQRRAVSVVQALVEQLAHAADRHAHLLERVAVAHRDGVVLERLVVDRDRPGRADLVLAAVAAADRAARVELDLEVRAQLGGERGGALALRGVVAEQRQDRRLDRRDRGVQAQQDALAPGDLLLVVGVAEEGQEGAVGARGGLDHVRHVALAVGLDDLELHARELGVLLEVVVAAVGDALELAPSRSGRGTRGRSCRSSSARAPRPRARARAGCRA